MLLVDTVDRVIIRDEELKLRIASSRPYNTWLKQLLTLDDLRAQLDPDSQKTQLLPDGPSTKDFRKQLSLFNYTMETLSLLLVPMFTTKYKQLDETILKNPLIQSHPARNPLKF